MKAQIVNSISQYMADATVYEYPDNEVIAEDIYRRIEPLIQIEEYKYLILSGEGGFRTEHSFLMECETLEEANEELDKFKTGEYKDTYLFIYKAIKIKEQ